MSDAGSMVESPASVRLTVLAPAHNEEENVALLAEQTEKALSETGITWELVVVDDGSTDRTREILLDLAQTRPWLHVVGMQNTPPGKGNGQSAAFHAGIRASRGELIATLDADLQNDPADIPQMLKLLDEQNADMVQGDRSHARQDSFIRKFGSRVGRSFRKMILGDTIRDTGCSLRVVKREYAMRLPLEFKGMHRFIPATTRHLGGKVIEMRVNHRERHAGETKYGMGIVQRAIPGLIDCFAVRYMRNRRRPVTGAEVTQHTEAPGT
ncbi:MAG: glycosyltransferase family 2 protein [Phycisphaeraceae bacterium]|nr:glycosyltransferase family 2 protein [Phycisphaerales bacterium]MCB9860461.1 glycosyltransferase family 2 protein [Phycisphaeraceae bacterium]